MTNLLVFWRDCHRNREAEVAAGTTRVWHSSARGMAALEPGDRQWLVTSGQGLGIEPVQQGWLVEVWRVESVIANPGDDPRYPRERYAHRVCARVDAAVSPAVPVNVDAILRPVHSPLNVPIGRMLQGPRRLNDDTLARLLAAVGSGSAPWVESHATGTVTELNPERIALGVRQPWVELILRGVKTIEVRTLETNVRGPVSLYASKLLAEIPAARQAIEKHQLQPDALPRGLLVGSVEIIDCRPATRQDAATACVPTTLLAGKQAWVLSRPQRLATPVKPRFLPYGVWFYPFRRRSHET